MLDRVFVQQLQDGIYRSMKFPEEENAELLPLLDAHPELASVRFADYHVGPDGANIGYAIHQAVFYGNLEVTERMIALGADVNGHGMVTPLEKAMTMYPNSIPRWLEMLELLLKSGADPNQPGSEGRPILHHAIQTEFPMAFVPLILRYGADPNRRDERGYAPLHLWYKAETYTEVLDTMVSYGADINAASAEGWTVLMTAIKIGGEAVTAVLRHGADVHAKTLTNWTALHASTLAHDYQQEAGSLEILLAAGASCHAKEERGYTPMHVAASCCDPEGVRLLLEAGAEINALSQHQQTPLDMVERRKNPFEPEDEGGMSAKEYRQMATFLRELGAVSTRRIGWNR